MAGVTSIPVTEQTLWRFVVYLAQEGLTHQKIKGYLSAIRHLQISKGLPDPFQQAHPKLEYTLKGIKTIQDYLSKGSKLTEPIALANDPKDPMAHVPDIEQSTNRSQ